MKRPTLVATLFTSDLAHPRYRYRQVKPDNHIILPEFRIRFLEQFPDPENGFDPKRGSLLDLHRDKHSQPAADIIHRRIVPAYPYGHVEPEVAFVPEGHKRQLERPGIDTLRHFRETFGKGGQGNRIRNNKRPAF